MNSGVILMMVGGVLFIVGVLLAYAPGALSWFGKLPGDFSYESDSVRVYFPFVSLVILNLILFVITKVFFSK